jgi:prohibitin 2
MNKFIFAVVALVMTTGCGFEQVDEGYRGIKSEWGKVVGDPLTPGLYFYNPISSGITEMDVREHKIEATTEAFTRDTQRVDVTYVVTFYPDQNSIGTLYSQFGYNWDEKLVTQTVLGSIKDVIGQYIADDLVSKREAAKGDAQTELTTALSSRNIIVTRLDFTNLNFDDEYEKAVELKVVAIQKAAEAKNRTVEVEEQSKQVVMTAKADAEAMRIKSQALSQNKGLIDFTIAERWDGKLPEIMMGSGSTPLINFDKLRNRTNE